jgi:collagenase-like PrtC family protease
MSPALRPHLCLGPVLFHWPAADLRDFYFRIADEADCDTVYVGEVVCSKRMPRNAAVLPAIIERLRHAGKEVVLSSLALISDDREVAAMAALIADAPGLVEANDASVLRLLRGRPHIAGPFINIYNEDALGFLVRQGVARACLPFELPGGVIARLAALSPVPLEVMVFGRVPLAISARCFHARAEGRSKDNCQFACQADADGRLVRTVEEVPFLALNGLQTLSARAANLLAELAPLAEAGVRHFRLSPHTGDMVGTLALFRAVAEGREEPAAASARLATLHPGLAFANGFYYGAPGHDYVTRPVSSATLAANAAR